MDFLDTLWEAVDLSVGLDVPSGIVTVAEVVACNADTTEFVSVLEQLSVVGINVAYLSAIEISYKGEVMTFHRQMHLSQCLAAFMHAGCAPDRRDIVFELWPWDKDLKKCYAAWNIPRSRLIQIINPSFYDRSQVGCSRMADIYDDLCDQQLSKQFSNNSGITVGEALSVLNYRRSMRVDTQAKFGKRSKGFMAPSYSYSTTREKFAGDYAGCSVIHFGSGEPGCLSRYCFDQASSVLFVDPKLQTDVASGEYGMTIQDFNDEVGIREDQLIVSDACVYNDDGLDRRTNDLHAPILRQGMIFKFCVAEPHDLPKEFYDYRYYVRYKARMHNAEIILEVAPPASGLRIEEVVTSVAYMIYNANIIRALVDYYGNVLSPRRHITNGVDYTVLWELKYCLYEVKSGVVVEVGYGAPAHANLEVMVLWPKQANLSIYPEYSFAWHVNHYVGLYPYRQVAGRLAEYALAHGWDFDDTPQTVKWMSNVE